MVCISRLALCLLGFAVGYLSAQCTPCAADVPEEEDLILVFRRPLFNLAFEAAVQVAGDHLHELAVPDYRRSKSVYFLGKITYDVKHVEAQDLHAPIEGLDLAIGDDKRWQFQLSQVSLKVKFQVHWQHGFGQGTAQFEALLTNAQLEGSMFITGGRKWLDISAHWI